MIDFGDHFTIDMSDDATFAVHTIGGKPAPFIVFPVRNGRIATQRTIEGQMAQPETLRLPDTRLYLFSNGMRATMRIDRNGRFVTTYQLPGSDPNAPRRKAATAPDGADVAPTSPQPATANLQMLLAAALLGTALWLLIGWLFLRGW